MVPKIAIISAVKSTENIQTIIYEFENRCEIEVLPYTQLDEIPLLYDSVKNDFDGFIFSGWLPYSILIGQRALVDKPHTFFNISTGDLYKTLFKLSIDHPGIDYRRVMVDDPQLELDMEELFPEGNGFIINSFLPLEYAMQSTSSRYMDTDNDDSNIYNIAMDSYRRAISANRIDIIITRVSNLAPYLSAENIPYYVLAPSISTMMDVVERMIVNIIKGSIVDVMTAYGVLEILDTDNREHNIMEFKRLLNQFNRENGMNLIIKENNNCFELNTTYKHLKAITDKLSSCYLSTFLIKKTNIPFRLGWGLAYDVSSAVLHADKALKAALKNETYIVDEADSLKGPLLNKDCKTYSAKSDEKMRMLAHKHQLSAVTIKKLIDFSVKIKKSSFSSGDLATSLGMSQRNSRRILSQLVKTGGAVCMDCAVSGTRGRPAPRYCLELELE